MTSSNGSPITKYKIFINKGSTSIDNGLNLEYTFSIVTTSKSFTFQYLQKIQSNFSLRMLASNLPSTSENLNKNLLNLKKGYISILWESPNDDGGLPILGYNIHLNNILYRFVQRNILSYTFSNYISPTISNSISVSAYNNLSEGNKITIVNVYSSSIPGKITRINIINVSINIISIKWNIPNDNGGSRINSYDLRINDGSEFGQN